MTDARQAPWNTLRIGKLYEDGLIVGTKYPDCGAPAPMVCAEAGPMPRIRRIAPCIDSSCRTPAALGTPNSRGVKPGDRWLHSESADGVLIVAVHALLPLVPLLSLQAERRDGTGIEAL